METALVFDQVILKIAPDIQECPDKLFGKDGLMPSIMRILERHHICPDTFIEIQEEIAYELAYHQDTKGLSARICVNLYWPDRKGKPILDLHQHGPDTHQLTLDQANALHKSTAPLTAEGRQAIADVIEAITEEHQQEFLVQPWDQALVPLNIGLISSTLQPYYDSVIRTIDTYVMSELPIDVLPRLIAPLFHPDQRWIEDRVWTETVDPNRKHDSIKPIVAHYYENIDGHVVTFRAFYTAS